MRKKRSERAVRTGGGKVLLLLFVVIPLLGIVLGYGVSKMLLIPYLTQNQEDTPEAATGQTPPGSTTDPGETQSPGDNTPQSPAGEEQQAVDAYQRVFDVEGFDLYRIQVGAFSSQENALALAEELNGKGMAAAVDTEGLYKVYTLYSFSREEAEKQLDKVREHYRDAHISKTAFKSVEIDFSESSSREAGMLRDQLRECKDMLVQIASSDAAGGNIESMVKEHRDHIGLFDAQISQTDWPPSMEEYKEEVAVFYTAVLESLSEYNQQTAIPGQVSMELINCYVELLRRLNPVI